METVAAKTIITRCKSRAWFGTDYNMNIYRGCCHGCIYCDSRSDCYHIERFGIVRAKENALHIIRDELRSKVRTGVVGTGSMSDPYNPYEEREQLTRHALELLDAYGFGVAVTTKSDLIKRDLDVLQGIQEHSPVLCKVTVTTWDDHLASKVEPHAPSPSRRLEAVKALADAGLFTGILLMPVLPYLEDNEDNILEIVRRAAESGARFLYPAFGVTLRQNQREYFLDKLEEAFPEQRLKERYVRRYGSSYECHSPRAKALWQSFAAACDSAGLLYKMQDIVRGYKQGYADRQIRLF